MKLKIIRFLFSVFMRLNCAYNENRRPLDTARDPLDIPETRVAERYNTYIKEKWVAGWTKGVGYERREVSRETQTASQ